MLPPHLNRYAPAFRAAGEAFYIFPGLLAAICDRESGGGEMLRPKGPTGFGDNGNGHGLMQIDKRYHPTFLAAVGPDGVPLWQVPAWNILYAAHLLRHNLARLSNDLVAAIAAYNASLGRVIAVQGKALELPRSSPVPERVELFDQLTTHRNYVSDVIERWRRFDPPPSEVLP